MTEATRLQLRASEIRQRLNEIAGLEGDDFTDEIRTEADGLSVEYRTVETKIRALTVAGDEPPDPDAGDVLPADLDPETRELIRLEGRATVANYVGAALEARAIDGAEKELNEALKLAPERFPLRLLAPREERATTDTDGAAMQRRWLDRLFSQTAAMQLGVSFEAVEPGISSHPVTTAGAAAAQRGRRQAAGDAAWTVGVTEIKPTRNSVRAVFSIEDAARLPGLEDALTRDLRMALTEGVDRAVFLGDAGANEDRGDITGLNTHADVSEVTISQANKIRSAGTMAVFAGLIDGKHATMPGNLNIVTAAPTNALWMSTVGTTGQSSDVTIAEFLRRAGFEWTVRGDLEDGTAADDFGAFIGLGRGIEGAAVAAVWDSGMLIRDPYSNAAEGEVALTLSHLWGFEIPRPSNFRRLKFVA